MENRQIPDGVTNFGGYTKPWWDSSIKRRTLIDEYNTKCATDLKRRYEILQELLGSSDEYTIIEPPFHCDNGKNIFLGAHFYANYNLTILDGAKITIGDRVVVGPNVTIVAAGHAMHYEDRFNGHSHPIITTPVTIGDDVWIGANVIIQMGVTIGSGSVIGSGSIVTRDIPDRVVAMGAPCKVYRPIDERDHYDWPEGTGL